jgi:hypothetical protein
MKKSMRKDAVVRQSSEGVEVAKDPEPDRY